MYERKIPPLQLPCALGFERQPSEACTAVNQHTREKLGFSSVIIGTFLSWGASTWRMRLLLVGWEYLCLGRLPKMHPQLTYSSCQRKWSSDMNTRACVEPMANGSRTMRKGDSRTPGGGTWACSSSLTSARREAAHLWQSPCPPCY